MPQTREDRTRTRAVGSGAALLASAIVAMMIGSPTSARAGGDWNDAGIKWVTLNEGVAQATKENKPICLIVYTEWCPHCANYSGVFHDPKVVEQSKNFVMVRVDKDKYPDISKKYAPDGEYIPRTYFLAPDGKLDPEIHAPRDQFKYFYDERVPGSVLGGMDEALKKLKPKETKA